MPFSSKATIEGTNLSAFLFWAHNSFEWERGSARPRRLGFAADPAQCRVEFGRS